MNVPTSTYRLQLRNGMTFERVERTVPHLQALGIDYLYLSPIMSAVRGSTHGYDVTDCNEIDAALGGRQGFDRLTRALEVAGLGLIVDIVPNHMAVSAENRWFADVLEFGSTSPFASYFDIDWRERLTLPILDKPLDEVIKDGELDVRRDPDLGEPCLRYFDTSLPLAPHTADFLSCPRKKGEIEALLQAQHWQLTCWKDASRHLSYRRFFEIAGLVGLRVEDEQVFSDSHRLIFELVKSGQVQGLRLDHIDGLADPGTYLKRLRGAVGSDLFIVVEKILAHGEKLPADWPVEGTTGYEFITALSDLLVHPGGLKVIHGAYSMLGTHSEGLDSGLRAAKTLMIDHNFQGEMERIRKLAQRARPDLSENGIAAAIRELLIAFPVYRTYGAGGALNKQDQDVLRRAVTKALGRVSCSQPLEWLASVLADGSEPALRCRFQQLSGAIMAKAMEDTLFYRQTALLALNEVGGEPDKAPQGLKAFHRQMRKRLCKCPHGLSATSTHDTKRGEDARARLYALSEAPLFWRHAFHEWSEMNRHHGAKHQGVLTPDPQLEWMLYQSLAGCWPEDNHDADDLSHRFVSYAEKAVREAKLATNWHDPDAAYEQTVKSYAAAMTSGSNSSFRTHFSKILKPFIAAGHVNSLAQTLIKLAAPGVPDIYQGSERLDLSLVDPDNRHMLDILLSAEAMAVETKRTELSFGALKLRIIQSSLKQRKEHPDLFAHGAYLPLLARGRRSNHVVAFVRHDESGDYAVAVASRFMFGHLADGSLAAAPEFWEDTTIDLPPSLVGPRRSVFSGCSLNGRQLALSSVLHSLPVALIAPG
ncbi:malto-oligosyltrehalose synthase [Rhizobium sp. R72]|uniref:malto-oligosyltrehalose synthase n=1 Tax=unclassified Rhizobium TaxID=2613769 RepID=UPI000B52C424|nr:MULTISPECIES: malto-oligosyltrehalose synthase [unclassified Rhizobium]OWW00149.1 malto-oligosyltrehalose synthase [Rhizobium sp. R72]OWW00540.1 malto-oligosyltrehalose synthase [Rhizobium sp. R711]